MSRIMHCHRCASPWDIDVMRVYPFPEDGYSREPGSPLWAIDVSPKVAMICHECWHEFALGLDMWIDESIWDTEFNPVIKSMELPVMIHDEERDITWDPETYYTANGPGGWPIN